MIVIYYLVYTEHYYLDCNLDRDLDQDILCHVNTDLDRDLDNFNPDSRWIAMKQLLNNEQQCDPLDYIEHWLWSI